jgi:Pirin
MPCEFQEGVMSRIPLPEPDVPDAVRRESIETLIVSRAVDVNPFVRRVLPAPQRQMVGPFIFFDQFGPLERIATSADGVRPHPHIGLATALSHLASKGLLAASDRLANSLFLLNPAPAQTQVVASKNG